MKKSTVILICACVFTLSSCGSSWSCKKRYCNTDKEPTKTIVVASTDNLV